MADLIHTALASFRDEILTSTARLEFQLRDIVQMIRAPVTAAPSKPKFWVDESGEVSEVASLGRPSLVEELEQRIKVLEATIQTLIVTQRVQHSNNGATTVGVSVEHDLLSMQAPSNTRNIIVKSHCGTPALTAAVAAANALPELVLVDHEPLKVVPTGKSVPIVPTVIVAEVEDDADKGSVVEEAVGIVEEEDDDCEGDVVEEEDAPGLTRMVLNNQVYFLDEDNTAYQETEDGYEEVGKFNPIKKCVEVSVEEEEADVEADEEEVEEEEVEEEEDGEQADEEEEGIEVEEFVFKGKTYQRDEEQNVYFDGEHIGTWDGKKIVRLTT
jgi:hypothetical protein